MNFEPLCQLYGLDTLQTVSPVRPGTVARVWRLECAQGVFLARTLRGPEQGQAEWTILRHLLDRGFDSVPRILPAADGAPMAELDGVWYQLQRFCPGARPNPDQPGIAREMARTAVRLLLALDGCPPVCTAREDLSLSRQWAAGRMGWDALGLPLSLEEADRRVQALAARPEPAVQVIHGDLGPWNMLESSGRLFVIDFGQARPGDPYFDLATALGGLVNHSSPGSRQQAAAQFLDQCGAMLPLDLPRLHGQLQLWVWRSLAQWAKLADRSPAAPRMAARLYSALGWSEELFS